MKTLIWSQLDPAQQALSLARPAIANDQGLRKKVASIIAEVKTDGDAALARFSRLFDGHTPSRWHIPASQLQQAADSLDPALRQAIENAKNRIVRFHQAQMPQDIRVETAPGVVCACLHRPIQRVGLYVPAGSAPLPSTVLMLAIPATIAGCPDIVLATPPGADGLPDPVVMATAALCGVNHVVPAGGAQAIAALAYGTDSIPKVDKIFGPGNAWVTEAKQQVAADPAGAAIDMPAGPSEVMVVADGSVPARFAAVDLLSQAEHGPDSQAILVTSDRDFLHAVRHELETTLKRLPRAETARRSLDHGRMILAPDTAAMQTISNMYAPEHLIVQLDRPETFLTGVNAAGSVFLGPWTPESLGDYCSGANHVLPTYGHARHMSGLSVTDFLLRITVQQASANGLRNIGPDTEMLARAEGLEAHRLAVSDRLAWLEQTGGVAP